MSVLLLSRTGRFPVKLIFFDILPQPVMDQVTYGAAFPDPLLPDIRGRNIYVSYGHPDVFLPENVLQAASILLPVRESRPSLTAARITALFGK